MTSDVLTQLTKELEGLPVEAYAEVAQQYLRDAEMSIWRPNPGPQTEAYHCLADVLLYGGEGGGGKSDLIGGLCLTAHRRSLVMRRQYTDLNALVDRVKEIDGTYKGFNGSPPPRLTTEDGRIIDFGAAAQLGDERHWMGQAHDLLAIDEVVHFLEAQVRLLMGWVRSAEAGQRSRTVFATNPPLTSEGDWIIGMFRPWLDLTHHNPAKHGELRYYVADPDGKDMEVDGPEPILFPGKAKPSTPHTRTFIRASLSDNPYLIDTGYDATLDAMPEPYRSAIRDGNFMAGRKDSDRQMIPTAWVREAQARWLQNPTQPEGVPMISIGCDPAGGGEDFTTICHRYDGWYGEIQAIPGAETVNGKGIAAEIIKMRKDAADIVIDMGGGYGGVPFTTLEDNDIEPIAYKGAEGSQARTADRKMGFYNRRSEAWWKFREALDPSQQNGSGIYLPDDQELLADLTSVRFDPVLQTGTLVYKAETKDDVKKRLNRSPDKGDAVVMAWWHGPATTKGQRILPKDSRDARGSRHVRPKVVSSKDHKNVVRNTRRKR